MADIAAPRTRVLECAGAAYAEFHSDYDDYYSANRWQKLGVAAQQLEPLLGKL